MRLKEVARIVAIAGAVLALSAVSAGASDHSGTVVAVDKSAGKLVLGEVGPWQVKGGKTVVVERTIGITPSTRFVTVTRSREAGPSGWIGELVEAPADPWAMKPGDFVTVRARKAAEGLQAEQVTISAGFE